MGNSSPVLSCFHKEYSVKPYFVPCAISRNNLLAEKATNDPNCCFACNSLIIANTEIDTILETN